jgi:nitric oxide reductase subunit B
MWYARSAGFMQTPLMETLRWLRAIGDTVFAVGIGSLVYFVFRLPFAKQVSTLEIPENAATVAVLDK